MPIHPDERCSGSGITQQLSSAEQGRAWTRCPYCDKVLRLRRNEAGTAAQAATLPTHKPQT